jgi:hypothetical protein
MLRNTSRRRGGQTHDFGQSRRFREVSVPKPRGSKSDLRKLIKEVGSVVGDPEDWLNSPNPRFEGRRPIDLIGTDDEIRVHIIIEAAQQGCFS